MKRVAAGDATAQRVVATRLIGRVKRVARSLLANHADAEDATQLGLMAVLRSASTFRGESSLERWSDRIAVRTTLTLARERRRRGATVDDGADLSQIAAPPSQEGATEAASSEVEAHLAQLSEEARTTLVLRHVLGHSVEECAEITGVSPNTVKYRLLSAREQLRKLIRRARMVESSARTGTQ
ncbi:MAG: RNA polymerase sigma factor [Polyangiales bacterium]